MSAFTVIGDDIIFELPEQYSDFTFEARSLTHNIPMFNNYVRNMPTSVAIDMVSSVPNAEYIAVQVNPITRFQQIIPSNRSSIRFDTNQTPSRAAILDKIEERLSSTNPQSRKCTENQQNPPDATSSEIQVPKNIVTFQDLNFNANANMQLDKRLRTNEFFSGALVKLLKDKILHFIFYYLIKLV